MIILDFIFSFIEIRVYSKLFQFAEFVQLQFIYVFWPAEQVQNGKISLFLSKVKLGFIYSLQKNLSSYQISHSFLNMDRLFD